MRKDGLGNGMISILVRRGADDAAQALRHLPAVAAGRAVRAPARGRRPRQAEARLLLRRGASPVRRGAGGADRQGGAGGPPDPVEGRGRLLRHPEPARHSRYGAGPARQPRAARAARLHAARSEGRARRRRDVPRRSEARHGQGHHRAGRGRGAGVAARCRGFADRGRARADRPAGLAHGPLDAGRTRRAAAHQPRRRKI